MNLIKKIPHVAIFLETSQKTLRELLQGFLRHVHLPFLAIALPALAQDFITYEQFGAVGDGKADDQGAIVAAHAAANSRDLPVKAAPGRTYYIGGGDAVAIVKTDVDFGDAKFIIDDRSVKNPRAEIFLVAASAAPVRLGGVRSLARGQTSLGIPLPGPSLVEARNSKVKQFIRYGGNCNNGSDQQEVFLADSNGVVDARTPILNDFASVTALVARPIDERTLVLKGGTFTTIANQERSTYKYHARGFSVARSNVRMECLRHEVTGEGEHGAPYGGFVSVHDCAHVVVTGCTFTAHRTYRTMGSGGVVVGMGSYDLSANKAIDVSYIDCRQTTDILDRRYWGLFGSNFCRDLLFDGCSFSRFDAHQGVANATIRNSRLGHMGINAIGYGVFRVENSTVYGRAFFNLRSDYGSFWNGDFVVKDCVFVPAGGDPTVGTLVAGSNNGKHDFGYACGMPRRIVFDGLRIEDAKHPKNYSGPQIFGMFNKERTSDAYTEPYPYRVTEEVVLRRVSTASGKPVGIGPNSYMFRNVKISRED